MATSGPNPYEEHITCSVCLEININPQALKCLHTFCYQCVQDLKKRNKIQCPHCRKCTNIRDIKQNFTAQSLIDIYQDTTTTSPRSPTEIVCDVCKESGKPVQSFCSNCEEHLCANCAKAHRGTKVTKSHKLVTFKELCKSKQDKVNKQITLIMDEITDIDRKMSSNTELINNIRQAEVRQKEEVNRCRKTIKQKVDDHHDELLEELQAINQDILETLEQQGQLLTQAKQQLKDKVSFLSDISESHDYSLLTDTLKSLSEQIQQTLKQIGTDVHKFAAHTKSPVSVVKDEDWDPLKSTRLEVVSTALVIGRDAKPKTKMQYQNKAIHPRYVPVKSVLFKYTPTKLCVYTDELWVGGGIKGLFVYDLDLQLIKHITHSQFKRVTSVIKTTTDIFVCDSVTGLHCLNQQGDYSHCISEGCFSDIGSYKNQLYVLDYEQNIIYIFTRSPNSWVKDTELRLLHYNEGHCNDKLCVISAGVYLSCYNTDCVQCYSHTGQFVYETGKPGQGGAVGEFEGPFLSDVESGGRRLLVCDWGNHRLQVFDTYTREWRAVTGLEGVKYLVCAVVGDKYLWVGNNGGWPNKLLKYEAKV